MQDVLPLVWALMTVAVSMLGLGAVVARRRAVPGSTAFPLMMAGVAVWAAAYALELQAPTLEGKMGWARVAYLGVATVPVAWFVLTLRIASIQPTVPLVSAISVVPFVTLESERKYRSILETIGEGYFELDLRGTIVACNDILRNILGYPAGEMLGLNFRQFTETETAEWLRDVFRRIHATGETFKELNHRVLRPDGSVVFVEVAAMPVTDSAGGRIGFRGLVRDVSGRVRADEALREAQEQIAELGGGPAFRSGDVRSWAAAVARDVQAGIRADRLDVWEVEGTAVLPLTDTDRAAPPLGQIEEASRQPSSGSMIPVLTTAGEICGVVVVESTQRVPGTMEQRILTTFARQLGAALEMARLRRQLASAEERRLLTRRDLEARGVDLLRICPVCGLCFGSSSETCSADGTALDAPHPLPYKLLDRYRFVRTLGRGGMGWPSPFRSIIASRKVA